MKIYIINVYIYIYIYVSLSIYRSVRGYHFQFISKIIKLAVPYASCDWLLSCRVYIRLISKHGCDVPTYFFVLFHKRNRKCTPCVYIARCKHSSEFGRIRKYLCKHSSTARVHINFRILQTLSLSCLHQAI